LLTKTPIAMLCFDLFHVLFYCSVEERALTGILGVPQPQDIIKEVEPVLDTDSEIFVVKMWRMLLFEVIRADSL
jgi:hypothetical protein